MTTRHGKQFVSALAGELDKRLGETPDLGKFVKALAAISGDADQTVAPADTHPNFAGNLPIALDGMRSSGGDHATNPLALCIDNVSSRLGWYQIYKGVGVDPDLAEGMFAGQVVGQVGLLKSDVVRTGLFLLAPGLHYPLHTHRADELYFCLSGSLTLQHGLLSSSFDLKPGQISVTPSNQLHSLKTDDRPALLVYVWIGDIDSPNWWWKQKRDGSWWREKWQRQIDASWAATDKEPVSHDMLAQALET